MCFVRSFFLYVLSYVFMYLVLCVSLFRYFIRCLFLYVVLSFVI